MEHDLYVTVSLTPHGHKVVMRIVCVGWKGRWLRRQQRLTAAFGWWLKQEVREWGSLILDLLRLVAVVLPSVFLARLGLPFGQPFFYWRARYWGIEANLSGIHLPHSNLEGSNLAYANLEAANLSQTCLRNAALMGTSLKKANLQRASLQRAVLMHADLRGADLRGADLRETVFSDADLQDARLNAADLRGAYLSRWWTRTGEVWTGCDRGADLRGADLTGANFTGAHYDDSTCWPEGFDPSKQGAERRD
jgi:hypothetical protein